MLPSFRIVRLSTEITEQARRTAQLSATDHAIVITTSPNEYPCRHCLHFAQPGERVVLFPFASIASGQPYAESGPIFVHEEHCHRYEIDHEFPSDLRKGRVLRAYDSRNEIIDAVIVNGSEPELDVIRLLANPSTAFLQARSADRGCFTFKIERADAG